jgi:SprT protein
MDLNKERVLGTCKYISKKLFEIRLNKTLYNKIGDEYLDDVFTHEYAHAITDDLYGLGVKPHGREFKSICRLLGIEGKATTDLLERHNITLKSNRSYRTFEYRCDCQTHILKKKSHNKAHYGGYLCKLCKTRLNFVKEL